MFSSYISCFVLFVIFRIASVLPFSRSWSLVDAHLRHEHAAYAEVVRSQGPALAATAKAVKAGKHPATALAQYHAGAGGLWALRVYSMLKRACTTHCLFSHPNSLIPCFLRLDNSCALIWLSLSLSRARARLPRFSERRKLVMMESLLAEWAILASHAKQASASRPGSAAALTPAAASAIGLADTMQWSASIAGYRTQDTRGDKLVVIGFSAAAPVYLVLTERMFHRVSNAGNPSAITADSSTTTVTTRQWHTSVSGFLVSRRSQCVLRLTADVFENVCYSNAVNDSATLSAMRNRLQISGPIRLFPHSACLASVG